MIRLFQCDCCGCCCRRIGNSPLYAELDRGDGVCKYLDGNLCSIYETRPLWCRVDECYELIFKDKMTRKEYEQANYEACKILKNIKEE